MDALVSLGSNYDNIGANDAVMIDERDIPNLIVEGERRGTPTAGINDKHMNIVDMNYESLSELITAMINGAILDMG